jgi:coatomer protein complex subunit alpha (xenin)
MFLGKAAVFIGKSKVVRSKDNTDLEIYNYETD